MSTKLIPDCSEYVKHIKIRAEELPLVAGLLLNLREKHLPKDTNWGYMDDYSTVKDMSHILEHFIGRSLEFEEIEDVPLDEQDEDPLFNISFIENPDVIYYETVRDIILMVRKGKKLGDIDAIPIFRKYYEIYKDRQ